MKYKYQLIISDFNKELENKIVPELYKYLRSINLANESLKIISQTDFDKYYESNLPTICLYLGNFAKDIDNLQILNRLINDAKLILPIYKAGDNFTDVIPSIIRNINGIELSNSSINSLISIILSGFNLVRNSRRLFISYKRSESTKIAIQLYEHFESNHFDVFLDTHSISPGDPFQEELWHRMADTDIIVILNTQGFLESEWTKEELAKASSMSIGMFQIIWPGHEQEKFSEFSYPYKLTTDNFGNSIYSNPNEYLSDESIKQITSEIESLRVRNLSSRHDLLITNFIKEAKAKGINPSLSYNKIITFKSSSDKGYIVVPSIGIPNAFTCDESAKLISQTGRENTDIYLLYDHICVRNRWIDHLSWLNEYLPIKSIKISEAGAWLNQI